jgi:hypothetical protein
MDDKFYQILYNKVVLPQFGMRGTEVVWGRRKALGPDESAWPFRIWDSHYVLVYEDYQGLGSNEQYVKDHVTSARPFEFVLPTSKTTISPSYDGLHFPVPYQYVKDITGTFTLIRLLESKDL